MKPMTTALAVAAALVMGGCSERPTPQLTPAAPAAVPPASAASAVAAVPPAWFGRWQGPEGTWLEIASAGDSYRVTVSNLDGPRSFDAQAGNGTLAFVRDGITETLRPGNGVDTGMKWLMDKRDCLVVKPGEGYCRG